MAIQKHHKVDIFCDDVIQLSAILSMKFDDDDEMIYQFSLVLRNEKKREMKKINKISIIIFS